jgi:hypothetical protein
MDSPDNQNTPVHPLVEPRFVGAVGIAALGFGVGIALMLARILLFWGLAVSLICAVAVIWIYAEHFSAAYRALKKKAPYDGAPPKELICAIVMIVFLIPISISVYITMSKEEPSVNRTIINADRIVSNKLREDGKHELAVSIRNVGNIAATKTFFLIKGKTSDSPLSENDIESELSAIRSAINKLDWEYEPSPATLQPGSSYSYSLDEVDKEKWVEYYLGQISFEPVTLTTTQLLSRKPEKYIYVFMIGRYEDEFIKDKGFWSWEDCISITSNFSESSRCVIPKIEKIMEDR